MAFRFRKSISLGKGARINLSKSGLGLSTGGKFGSIGVGPRGIRTSANVPGTGLGYQSTKSLGGSSRRSKQTAVAGPVPPPPNVGAGVALVVAMVFAIAFPPLFLVIVPAWLVYRSRPVPKARRLAMKAKPLLSARPAEALTLLEEAHTLNPQSNEILTMAGAAAHAAGDYNMAVRFFAELIRHVPATDNILLRLGHALFQSEQYDEAIRVLQEITEESDLHTKAVLVLGMSFVQKGDDESAIDVFKRGPLRKRNLDDDLKEIHYQLGDAYSRSGDTKAAQRHYKRVYTVDVGYRDVEDKVTA